MGAYRLEEAEYQFVRTELKTFGLNPDEWTLEKETSSSLEFVHREDENFRINVTIETPTQGLVRVDQLSVISL